MYSLDQNNPAACRGVFLCYHFYMLMVDVESSGTVADKHSILSIGALDLDHPEHRFYGECRVWDGAHIQEEALAVNGFTEEEARDSNKKTEAELIREFMEWSQHMLHAYGEIWSHSTNRSPTSAQLAGSRCNLKLLRHSR